tara:strand:+ start:1641 stop:1850 length:210 start_codon:yes stop_codon:yes gene_type:complete
MSIERVLDNNILRNMRDRNIISEQEVIVQVGDLFFAKNVISNEKRIISIDTNGNNQINETKSEKQLLKG